MTFPLYHNFNHRHNAHLKIGEKVRCIKPAVFLDFTRHRIGDVIVVDPETNAYLSLFTALSEDSKENYHAYIKL